MLPAKSFYFVARQDRKIRLEPIFPSRARPKSFFLLEDQQE
jgi:hypothetical protein